MKRFWNHKKRLNNRRRGAVLLEFVFVLPLFFFFVLLILDLSRVMLATGAAQEAAYRSARAGAVYGGAQNRSEPAFQQALGEVPGGGAITNPVLSVRRGNLCTVSDPFVVVDVNYQIKFMTPGLGQLVKGAASSWGDGYQMNAVGVSRCEVAVR